MAVWERLLQNKLTVAETSFTTGYDNAQQVGNKLRFISCSFKIGRNDQFTFYTGINAYCYDLVGTIANFNNLDYTTYYSTKNICFFVPANGYYMVSRIYTPVHGYIEKWRGWDIV